MRVGGALASTVDKYYDGFMSRKNSPTISILVNYRQNLVALQAEHETSGGLGDVIARQQARIDACAERLRGSGVSESSITWALSH